VAGINDGVSGECQQFLLDLCDQKLFVAARQIPPADPARKERVSAENHVLVFDIKANTARTVPGNLQEREVDSACSEWHTFLQQCPWFDGLDLHRKPPLGKKSTFGKHRTGIRMDRHRAPVTAVHGCRIRDVVEVAVGQDKSDNFLSGEVIIGTFRSVDKHTSIGSPQQVGIGLKTSTCKFFELYHENVVICDMLNLILKQSSASVKDTMRIKRLISPGIAALAILLTWTPARADTDMDKVAVSVARLLEQGHYSRQSLNADVSKRLFERYLADLDSNRLFFLESDVEEFRRQYETSLDQSILSGNLNPAREIFARYKERVEARVAKNLKLSENSYDFTSDRTVQLDRKEMPWPKDAAEADQIWADRIEAELLEESLNEHATDSPAKVIARRQNQILRNVNDMTDEEVVSGFLSALARTYDPHTTYMSPSELESFRIEMEKSLEGVGAVLTSEDGYTKVREIVPGGPADLQGTLRVNDRIVAVAQGEKEFEDIVDLRLDKVVQKIRGKRGTTVRLQVIPSDAVDASKREVIAIRRDKVELNEQKAKAELLDFKREDGRSAKLGWIEVPSFYADSKSEVSTTGDVLTLLSRLKKEGIEGVVVDLRRDGGGSLEEAIKLTGLFIPKGPVVLSKDSNGKVSVSNDTDPSIAYAGPVVVLMNRLSASASEIFAAALQDYGVAVVVGDERSFGKGTVQTMLDISRFMPFFSLGAADAGALKLTINKYYRVKGGSTQLEGVRSDIIIPSLTDNPEIGEGALPNALPYDEVAPQRIETDPVMASILPELQNRSSARVASDPEFSYILEDMARLRQRIEDNTVSLNMEERKAERDADTARKEKRVAKRKETGPVFDVKAYELTLDNVDQQDLQEVAFDRTKKKGYAADEDEDEEGKPKEPQPDAVRNEAIRIAKDLIEVRAASQTASVRGDAPVVR